MSETTFRIRRARWQEEREALRQVRETVFVQEQQVPPEAGLGGMFSWGKAGCSGR